MKKTHPILCLPLILMACATTPIAEQLEGKDEAQALAILNESCEDESGRGHHTGSHPHTRYRPENKTHAANVVSICKQMAAEPRNRIELSESCKAEAAGGSFSNRYVFDTHVARLVEICEGYRQFGEHQR